MKRIELVLIAIAVLGICLDRFSVPGINVLLVMTLAGLAMFYFFFGVVIFSDVQFRGIIKTSTTEEISPLRKVWSALAGVTSSIIVIGILFKVQRWPTASLNLNLGLFAAAVISAISIFKYAKTKASYYLIILKRMIILSAIAVLIASISA